MKRKKKYNNLVNNPKTSNYFGLPSTPVWLFKKVGVLDAPVCMMCQLTASSFSASH